MTNPTDQDIALFMGLFRGRDDVYALKWEKRSGEKGYSPACNNKFKKDVCSMPCRTCTNEDLAPLDAAVVREHLQGKKVVGCYPIMEGNTVQFAAVDFDDHDGNDPADGSADSVLEEVKKFVAACEVNEFPVYVERSQGGKGYHAWFFLDAPIAAHKVRQVVLALVQEANPNEDMESFDRMFPNQDVLKGKKFGNLIALPMQGFKKVGDGRSAFLDKENNYRAYSWAEHWDLFSNIDKVTEQQLDELITEWQLDRKETPKPAERKLKLSVASSSHTQCKCTNPSALMDCEFIRHCDENRATLPEPLWFAMVSNVAPVDRQRVHSLSEGYPAYSFEETEAKIEHVLSGSAPITCETIRQSGFNCSKRCSVKSPAGLASCTKSGKKLPEIIAALEKLDDPKDINAIRNILRDVSRLSSLEQAYALNIVKRTTGHGLKALKDEMAAFKDKGNTEISSLTNAVIIDNEVYYVEGNSYKKATVTVDGIDKPRTLTNFVLRPTMRINMPEGEVLRADVVTDRTTLKHVDFPRDAWNSKAKFADRIPSYDAAYYGNDYDIAKMIRAADILQTPRKNGTKVLGYHNGLWVTRDSVISKDGILDDPPTVYVNNGSSLEDFVSYGTNDTNSLSEICELLPRINEFEAIIPIIGWYFATPFASRIRKLRGHFPLLFGWGTRGAGKTETVRLMQELFGVVSEPYSITKTTFTLTRLLSATNGVPVFLDEYKPYDMKKWQVRDIERKIRTLYTGEVEERGSADLSVNKYVLVAPVAIVGEQAPTEPAIMERIILVNFNPDIPRASYFSERFRAIRKLDLRSFGYHYIKFTLGVDAEKAFSEAETFLDVLLDGRSLPPRVKDNIAVMLMGFQQFESFAKQFGVIFDDVAIEAVVDTLLADWREDGSAKVALDDMLENLSVMASKGYLKPNVDFAVNNGELYLHMQGCYNTYKKYARECDIDGEILNKKAFLKQAEEIFTKNGYVTGLQERKYFGGSSNEQRRAIVIDLSKASETLDLTGFTIAQAEVESISIAA